MFLRKIGDLRRRKQMIARFYYDILRCIFALFDLFTRIPEGHDIIQAGGYLMLKIAICDDDVEELENTVRMIVDFTKEHHGIDFKVRRFHSSYDLEDCISSGISFDLYLLDILMPVIDGIGVGEKIRENDETAVIIYLTASMDFAVKSYRVAAFDYLIKPVEQKMLLTILKKAMDRIDIERSKSVLVKTKDGITAVPHHHILAAEYVNRTVKYYLSDGSLITSVTLREPFDTAAKQLMQDNRFIQPHTSYVVNMRFIRSVNNRDFLMANDSLVPISRNRYAEVKNEYLDFLLSGGEHR